MHETDIWQALRSDSRQDAGLAYSKAARIAAARTYFYRSIMRDRYIEATKCFYNILFSTDLTKKHSDAFYEIALDTLDQALGNLTVLRNIADKQP